MRFVSTRAHAVPLVRDGIPLGVWAGPAWDPRRTLPPHATHFVEELATFASRMSRRARVHATPPPFRRQTVPDYEVATRRQAFTLSK